MNLCSLLSLFFYSGDRDAGLFKAQKKLQSMKESSIAVYYK